MSTGRAVLLDAYTADDAVAVVPAELLYASTWSVVEMTVKQTVPLVNNEFHSKAMCRRGDSRVESVHAFKRMWGTVTEN